MKFTPSQLGWDMQVSTPWHCTILVQACMYCNVNWSWIFTYMIYTCITVACCMPVHWHSKLWTTFPRVGGRRREKRIPLFYPSSFTLFSPHPPTSRPGLTVPIGCLLAPLSYHWYLATTIIDGRLKGSGHQTFTKPKGSRVGNMMKFHNILNWHNMNTK